MKIAELFAQIGLKGTGEVVNGLQTVKNNAINANFNIFIFILLKKMVTFIN